MPQELQDAIRALSEENSKKRKLEEDEETEDVELKKANTEDKEEEEEPTEYIFFPLHLHEEKNAKFYSN
jgi:hypothetical protein